MKKINFLLRKCKSLSRQLGRSSSYSSLRSKSTREDLWVGHGDKMHEIDHQHQTIIFVGSTRKRYVISSRYLNHPLLNALIDKSSKQKQGGEAGDILVNCEVVLFDHLIWMLENAADPSFGASESLEELAALYVF
ncbi:auxin-responsive protein SAUR71 [Prunus avium]|uniref:Auxin-responsive protein SAUR71 n=1 Tax=Prunus avium TaxID=42229 RepID=A0A6P5SQS8_PRUAV|nr:auxin-responsive protein SAUR71 [Prunus avium]